LIINADDLGADQARNEGIFEALEAGVVTAASILVNGNAFQNAVQRIVSTPIDHVSFGVHLNLTEGRPLSTGLKRIADADGLFHGKAAGQKLMMTRNDKTLEEDIIKETAAQILRLKQAGVRIDHLDGHHHIHVFPAVTDIAVKTAVTFGIPWIRIPDEPYPAEILHPKDPILELEAQHFSLLAAAARPTIKESSMQMTDYFRGLYLKGRLSLNNLDTMLQTLPPGLTEFMVHPGRMPIKAASGPFSSFSNRDRQEELTVLKDPGFRVMLNRYHIQITHFPEAAP